MLMNFYITVSVLVLKESSFSKLNVPFFIYFRIIFFKVLRTLIMSQSFKKTFYVTLFKVHNIRKKLKENIIGKYKEKLSYYWNNLCLHHLLN